ncbi:MAG: NADH-quinone oxidoreductase subunit F [Candidatus Marinimicrobia bacterium]|nr:NADH-quinone oxidoreductase subunit F [Candidatus Neomarinimicrobiota bacterium]
MVNPILLLAIPLGGTFAIPLFGFLSKHISKYIALIVSLAMVVIVGILIPEVSTHPIVVKIGGFRPPFGINLVVSPLSLFFAGIISLVGFLVSIYAIRYIKEGDVDKYHILFLLFLTGSVGVVLTGDIFNIFVFFEILCISSYALVAYNRDKDGVEAGIKYLIQGSVGSAFILIGIGLLYGLFGSLNMADIANQIHSVNSPLLFLALFLFITGFGVEGAIFPLNAWLPDAHSSAPSTISAVLSGFAIEVGIYAVVRFVWTIFGASSILHFLAGLGILTLLVGELSAFIQDDMKRLLAYSSIGQIGLILFAISIGTPEGISGGLFQVLSHALSKALLFLATGYMIYKVGSKKIKAMKGIGRRMPVTSLCFVIGAFSLVGLPPFIGFPSKFIIVKSALLIHEGYFYFLVGGVLLGTVIEISYFFKLLQGIFSRTSNTKIDEAPLTALVPIVVLTLLIVGIGVYPQIINNFLKLASANLIDRMGYINQVLGAL